MGFRDVLKLLFQARTSNERTEHQIDGAIAEVKRQQDRAERLDRLELGLKVHDRRK